MNTLAVEPASQGRAAQPVTLADHTPADIPRFFGAILNKLDARLGRLCDDAYYEPPHHACLNFH